MNRNLSWSLLQNQNENQKKKKKIWSLQNCKTFTQNVSS